MISLASCAPAASPTSTTTLIPATTYTPVAPTLKPTPITMTPLPTQPTIPILTPDALQVERWKEYQAELAKSLIPEILYISLLCEWDILGRSGEEIYVWAVCGNSGSGGENPAVIHLNTDGSIKYVENPGHGSAAAANTQKMFPDDVKANFKLYSQRSIEMGKHLMYRLTHRDEPPLIILNTTPTP